MTVPPATASPAAPKTGLRLPQAWPSPPTTTMTSAPSSACSRKRAHAVARGVRGQGAPHQPRGQPRGAQGTYPARCFLDLSEMPSRDMSLLNTMMPTSIFTLGESGATVRARHRALREGGGLGVQGSGSAHQHDDGSGSHEGVEQTALQREPAAAGDQGRSGADAEGTPPVPIPCCQPGAVPRPSPVSPLLPRTSSRSRSLWSV